MFMVAEIKHTIELYIVTAGAEIAKELQHKYVLYVYTVRTSWLAG